MTEPTINYDEHPIDRIYVEWANSLDSAGTDSGPARERLDPTTISQLFRAFAQVIEVGNAVDVLKKWVFYGKTSDQRLSTDNLSDKMLMNVGGHLLLSPDAHNNIRILHAIMGLIGEASELTEMFVDRIFKGHEVDMQNLVEESGDALWYMALLAKASGHLTFDEFMMGNKAKLTARYGTSWNQDGAINRDTENEMTEMTKAIDIYPEATVKRKDEAVAKFPTLSSIVSQLSACMYESKTGESIENNLAFEALRWYAYREFMKTNMGKDGDIDPQQSRLG